MSNAPRKERRTPQPNIAGGIVRAAWIPEVGTHEIIVPVDYPTHPAVYYFNVGVANIATIDFEPLISPTAVDIPITDNIKITSSGNLCQIVSAEMAAYGGGIRVSFLGLASSETFNIAIKEFAPEWCLVRGFVCPGYFAELAGPPIP